jgi:hypothetical protein
MSGSQAIQGAAGGGMAGFAIGGPVGGLVGAGLGALGGYLGGDGGKGKYEAQLKALSDKYANIQAPQMGFQSAGYSGFRQNQAGLMQQLSAMGRGEGPSAAAMQMREAMDRAAGAQASAAAGAGGRGVNAGAALRNATNNTAAFQAQGARDTATIRAQEQMAALGQLGQVIGQGRQADESINAFNAGQKNDASRTNAQLNMQALGLSTQAEMQALMAAMGSAPPGMGTQILAAGASAMPLLMQRKPMAGPASPTAAITPQQSPYVPMGDNLMNPWA